MKMLCYKFHQNRITNENLTFLRGGVGRRPPRGRAVERTLGKEINRLEKDIKPLENDRSIITIKNLITLLM